MNLLVIYWDLMVIYWDVTVIQWDLIVWELEKHGKNTLFDTVNHRAIAGICSAANCAKNRVRSCGMLNFKAVPFHKPFLAGEIHGFTG